MRGDVSNELANLCVITHVHKIIYVSLKQYVFGMLMVILSTYVGVKTIKSYNEGEKIRIRFKNGTSFKTIK
jgi:hypothetical protein